MAEVSPRQVPDVLDPSGWGRSNRLWLAVSISMLALLGVAGWVVVSGTDQPLPPFLRGAEANDPRPAPTPRHDGGLHLAGSGSNLPMTRALSAAFPREPSLHPVVHASIGSAGGVRALLDGVIDIALVSRPLQDGEREQGLVATPYARVPVVVAAHASGPDDDLDSETLVAIYDGRRTQWSDGTPIVVLQREPGDSSHSAVARVLPGFEEVNARAYHDSRWRVLYRDDVMREALADTRGAIGLFGQGRIPAGLPIAALRIDGVRPSAASVEQGRYPFSKDFAFVTRGQPRGEAAAFIEFSRSEPGRRIIERAGGIPLGGRPLPGEQESPVP